MEILVLIPFVCYHVSIVIALFCLIKRSWRHKAACFLLWMIFPPLFPHFAQKYGLIKRQWKSWLLVLVSPPLLFLLFIFAMIFAWMSTNVNEAPPSIAYSTAADLRKVTGVEFPEVTPVDSLFHDEGWLSYTMIKFVPTKGFTEKDFQRLDRACTEDSCCWSKDSLGYHYEIYPERPLDRTKGSHRRTVEMENEDGTKTRVPDWDGDYVSVFIPLKGDTITLEDGWTM